LSSTPTPPEAPQLTLLEVRNHLFVHFLQKTTFNLAEDLRGIKLGADFDEPSGKLHPYKSALVVAGLDELVKNGVLLVLDASHGTYMLTQPLGTFTQSVQVSPYTAHLVGDAFNFFARGSPTTYVANKLALTDSDIQAVALIVFALRDQLGEMAEQIEELEQMLNLDGDGPEGDEDGFPPLGADTPENN
jgi:hypothetical protein